jgi:N-acetyl-anhydromuramyl-L-alanine amidase AmpD
MLGNWNRLLAKRGGIMLHYDDSCSDASAQEWLLKDPACHVSYNKLFLDNGDVVQIAPDEARAWHAGVCKPSNPRLQYRDANSYFFGFAIAANGKDHIKPAQFDSLVRVCVEKFRLFGWTKLDLWRISSHSLEAWPRGRKVDIEGTKKNDPVCSVEAVRAAVAAQL